MVSEARKVWRERNRDKTRAYTRKFRLANLEKVRKQNRDHWRQKRGAPEPTRECPTLCECCGRPPSAKRALATDHCHETKVFRGWLCHRCNTALGLLGDTLESVSKAVAYLERQ